MNSFYRTLGSLLTGAFLLVPSSAFAQVDSFFDIFVDPIGDINLQCDPCALLRRDIANLEKRIEFLNADLEALDDMMTSLEEEVERAQNERTEQEEALEEMRNPQNYVESEGRRYDSSDHAAMKRRNAHLWSEYKAGDMSAEEYSDAIAKDFDDPDVQKELEKYKNEIEKELEDTITELNNQLDTAELRKQEWNKLGTKFAADLDAATAELDALRAALEDCENRCQQEPINLPEDYGIGQQDRGPFDWIFDLFQPEMPTIPGVDTIVPRLDDPPTFHGEPLPGGGVIPIEIVDLNLQGVEPLPVNVDNFFDVFTQVDLPPAICHKCDPIRAQLRETAENLQKLQKEKAQLEAKSKAAYEKLGKARAAKDAAEQALDALNNPQNYAESEGRRYDSSDHAAMQSRNARLWADYKSGRMSASDLEAEWAKPFDDPGVAAELEQIKQKMKAELEKAIQDAQAAIDALNKEISAIDDRLVELAGRIAAHNVIITSLKEQLEECEKECAQPEPTSLEDFLFPEGFETGKGPAGLMGDDSFDEDGTDMDSGGKMDDGGSRLIDEEEEEEEEEVDEDESDEIEGEVAPIEPKKREQKVHFMCSWFGVFCPKQEPLTIADIIACANGKEVSTKCDSADHNADGTVDAADYAVWRASLEGPKGLSFPLDISRFDGEPGISTNDFVGLNDCIANGPSNCSGLDFGMPDDDILIGGPTPPNVNGGDFNLQLANGSDLILGDPINNDLVNIGGGQDDILGGGSNDALIGGPDDDILGPNGDDRLFGPGSDPFNGPLDGAGVDIIGGSTVDDVPPPPSTTEQNMATDPQVRQVVAAAVAAYLKQNPLGPCEKLIVKVSRVRIGNRVRYTVTITRVRDEALCPSQCPDGTSYQSLGAPTGQDCAEACQNGVGGCVVLETLPDGTNCILCGPNEEAPVCNKDGGFATMESCQTVCPDPSLCSYDGGSCYMCDRGDEDRPVCGKFEGYESMEDCQRNCGDPASCGYDGGACYLCGMYQEEEVECAQNSEKCSSAADCHGGESCIEGCCELLEPVSSQKCPDLAYSTEGDCRQECSMGECQYRQFEDYFCYFCAPTDLPPPSSSSKSSVKEQCDSPTMTEGACRSSCNGTCTKSYTRNDGEKCYTCMTPNDDIDDEDKVSCPTDSVLSCGDCPGNTTCESISDSCFSCEPIPIDLGPSCPSGTTSDQNACDVQCGSQGGVCLNEDGCYSCVVVNCPDGTHKNECPDSCSDGCDVVGSQHGVSCYQCKQSCTQVCEENGYGPENTDHSNAILGELNAYSCVSGANISIQTATIGSCNCVGLYTLSVDETVPVCSGTPCGDVACGESASCPGGPNETITVNCNWGGWEKIQKHQFKPVIGN